MEKDDSRIKIIKEQYDYLQSNINRLKKHMKKYYLSENIIYAFLGSYLTSMQVAFAFSKNYKTFNNNSNYLKLLTSSFYNNINMFIDSLCYYSLEQSIKTSDNHKYIFNFFTTIRRKDKEYGRAK